MYKKEKIIIAYTWLSSKQYFIDIIMYTMYIHLTKFTVNAIQRMEGWGGEWVMMRRRSKFSLPQWKVTR